MVVLSQNHLKNAKKLEFYKLKTFLDAQKGVISWFHHDFIIIILLIFDALLLLVLCLITIRHQISIKKEEIRETWCFNFNTRSYDDLQKFYYLILSADQYVMKNW